MYKSPELKIENEYETIEIEPETDSIIGACITGGCIIGGAIIGGGC